jgi:hypothetical protein
MTGHYVVHKPFAILWVSFRLALLLICIFVLSFLAIFLVGLVLLPLFPLLLFVHLVLPIHKTAIIAGAWSSILAVIFLLVFLSVCSLSQRSFSICNLICELFAEQLALLLSLLNVLSFLVVDELLDLAILHAVEFVLILLFPCCDAASLTSISS